MARFGDINQTIASTFGNARMSESQLHAFVDRLPFGIVIIDRNRQIILSNSASDRFLRTERLLVNANGKLRTTIHDEQLTAVLDQSLGRIGGAPAPAAFSRRRDAENDTMIQILGIPLTSSGNAAAQTAIVVIDDSSVGNAVPLQLLKGLYGFTEKESRLAHALVSGMTVSGYCEKTFITLNTARTHLKSIYLKTSTNRQAELISLLSRPYINLADDE